MRVNHKLLGRALVKIRIASRRVLQRNHLHIHSFGDFDFVIENCIHQVTVVFHHGALAGIE